MGIVSLRLPDDLLARLDKECGCQGMSRTDLIKHAITVLLEPVSTPPPARREPVVLRTPAPVLQPAPAQSEKIGMRRNVNAMEEALPFAREAQKYGYSLFDIAEELNSQGMQSPSGKPWTQAMVAYLMNPRAQSRGRCRNDAANPTRRTIERLRNLIRTGHTPGEVADILNLTGSAPYGDPWTAALVADQAGDLLKGTP